MERRSILKGFALGGMGAGALALGQNASAIAVEGSQSSAAFAALLQTLGEIERTYLTPEYGVMTPQAQAEGRRYLAHLLMAAISFQNDADPDRPWWRPFITPYQKLLGDNPDAFYFTCSVNPMRRYIIRGNVVGAAYTSFSVERNADDSATSRGVGATLNDTQFDVAPDGSYEIAVGGPPRARNWLSLGDDGGAIVSRHYFERERSVAADPTMAIPLSIAPLDTPPPPSPPDDASVAAGLRRVARFVQAGTQVFVRPGQPMPPYVSATPNVFVRPDRSFSNATTGFAAVDNVYLAAPFVLGPDEALVMTGRFPRCRFANVVLWNRFFQTLDYLHRRVSLNRRQIQYEADGSFRIVLAARDPGVPNWLDTEGRAFGQIFWRFQLPEEDIAPIETALVPIDSLRPT
jgi:hypothetical protein